MKSEENPWKTLRREQVYKNPWISLSHREVINPSGGPGIYGVVEFQNLAIGALPIDEEDHTWLVGQYRYTLDVYSWEIPEGGCPLEEDPLDAAKRELLEETGLKARQWELLLPEFHVSNSVTNERGMVFTARGLAQQAPQPEDTEALRLRRLPLRDAVAMAQSGEITDIISLAALFRIGMIRGW